MSNMYENKQTIFKGGTKLSSNVITVGGLVDADYGENAKPVLDRAQLEAAEIVKEAKFNAEEIIKSANTEVQNIQDKAHQEGYEAGLSTGREEAIQNTNQELKGIMTEAHSVLEAIKKERDECLESEEERVLEFISLLTKKLIFKELSYEPESIIPLIKEAIKTLDNKAEVNILINSQTAGKLNEIKESISTEIPGIESISVSGSDSLAKGDFILESNKERLDLRLESQIEKLLDTLNE